MSKLLTRLVENNRTRHQNTEANTKSFKSQIEFEVNAQPWESLRVANNPVGRNKEEEGIIKESGYSIRIVPVPLQDRLASLSNLTTHGFRLLGDHPDFQIVLGLEYPAARTIFEHIYNLVKAGKRFQDGEVIYMNENVVKGNVKIKLTMYKMYINFVHIFRAVITIDSYKNRIVDSDENRGQSQLEYCPPFQGICDDCSSMLCRDCQKRCLGCQEK